MTYNNPVFVEQCKIRGKNFDELNTGWVPQRAIGEIEETMADPEDEDEDEDLDWTDEDENELFRPAKPSRPEPPSRPERSERPSRFERPDRSKESNRSEPVKSEAPKNDFIAAKPEMSMDDLASLFGDDTSTSTNNSNSSTTSTDNSNRTKVMDALGTAEVKKPVIKLNIDKTKLNNKPKLKLNFNKKPEE